MERRKSVHPRLFSLNRRSGARRGRCDLPEAHRAGRNRCQARERQSASCRRRAILRSGERRLPRPPAPGRRDAGWRCQHRFGRSSRLVAERRDRRRRGRNGIAKHRRRSDRARLPRNQRLVATAHRKPRGPRATEDERRREPSRPRRVVPRRDQERAFPTGLASEEGNDHTPRAAGVQRLLPMAGTVALVVLIEFLTAAKALGRTESRRVGDALQPVLALLRDRLPTQRSAPINALDLAVAADLVRSGALAAAPGIPLPSVAAPAQSSAVARLEGSSPAMRGGARRGPSRRASRNANRFARRDSPVGHGIGRGQIG